MKVKIKEPCHEDWNKMKIGLISRHCDVCDKAVFDFTQKTREEIIIHLLSNPNESVCGRMHRDQFDFYHEDIPILIEALKKQPSQKAFLILTLVCLSLVSCSDTENSKQVSTRESVKGEKTPYVLGKVEHKKEEAVEQQNDVNTTQPTAGEVIVAPLSTEEPPPVVAGGITIQDSTNDKVCRFAQKMPEFPGGMEALQSFIKDNIKYPQYEKEKGIEGTVYVQVKIGKNGTISDPKILKNIVNSKNFETEVIRVIQIMPNWIPGENDGKTVDVTYNLPFRFKLD